ncbi:MAG: hypothetical protein HN929_05060 [Chloroflexi bacterium]|mgnify:CR=1 FL=1|jgi:hypothetical protein|nr:hypothetical protein [Chloroflexota bacterium]MBT7080822.1 hypothetical protein [Chloroflexota bacterium]MBT7289035.1 hypothetical protein [Chloroflexota bacterium]
MKKRGLGIVLIIMLVLVIPGTINCSCAGDNPAGEIEETITAYVQAYASKDATAMLDLQTTAYTASLSGGHQTYWENRWGDNTDSITELEVTIVYQNATVATASAICNIKTTLPNGSTWYQGSWQWNYTLVKTDKVWLISSEIR